MGKMKGWVQKPGAGHHSIKLAEPRGEKERERELSDANVLTATIQARLNRSGPEVQIRGGIEDTSKTIFLSSQRKHML